MSKDKLALAAIAFFEDAPIGDEAETLKWLKKERAEWDPENNSKDSFGLMVALNLNVFSVDDVAYAMASETDDEMQEEFKVPHGRDKFSAMRQAIFSAAACYGENKLAYFESELEEGEASPSKSSSRISDAR